MQARLHLDHPDGVSQYRVISRLKQLLYVTFRMFNTYALLQKSSIILTAHGMQKSTKITMFEFTSHYVIG